MQEGAIVRISLQNFVTFDKIDFQAGPNLNVIIGPNGTGKSSIVCAICLGLGGKPNLLGRASQPCDFIKHGKKEATIKLELYNSDGDNTVVCRTIYKSNQSKWTVNGRNATQKTVEQKTARLNIQVNNLCQFLPQDKVADFAKMNPRQLLESTEQTIEADELYDLHSKLKTSRSDMRKLESDVTDVTGRLKEEKLKNTRLKEEVSNYRLQKKYLARIKTLKRKRISLEWEKAEQEYQEMKAKKDAAVADYNEMEKLMDRPRSKLEKLKSSREKAERAMRCEFEELQKAAVSVKKCGDAIDLNVENTNNAADDLKVKKQQSLREEKKLSDMSKQLQMLETELKNLSEVPDVQPELDRLEQEMRSSSKKCSQKRQEEDNLKTRIDDQHVEMRAVVSELQRLRDVNTQREQYLNDRYKHPYQALQWLRKNRDKFKHHIYDPIVLTIDMKKIEHAKYVENHIPDKDLVAFVCEDKADMNRFTEIVRGQMNLSINVVCDPKTPLDHLQPAKPIAQYKQYGFHSYLSDMFTCPDAVMRYLRVQYNVHNIPVGSQYTKNNIARVTAENPNLRTIFTDNHKYTMKTSVYSRITSTRSTELRPACLIKQAIDKERVSFLEQNRKEREDALADARQRCREIGEEQHALQQQITQLRARKRELQESKASKQNLESKIRIKKDSINSLKRSRINMEVEEKITRQKISRIQLEQCKLAAKLKDIIRKCLDHGKMRTLLAADMVGTHIEIRDMEISLSNQETLLREKQMQLTDLRNNTKEFKTTVDHLKRAMKRAQEEARADGEDINAYEDKDYEEPKTLQDLDDHLHEAEARAKCCTVNDPNALRDFEDSEERLQALQTEHSHNTRILEDHITMMNDAKTRWLLPLKEKIAEIDQHFGYFFKKMKCAGEIELDVPENPEDYEQYGINIKVKFRDTDSLRVLNPYHQSGGERSVSTMLYLMALQKLTTVPFRCVDEINQGMDVHNERRVFELIVETSCTAGSAQYFLLTPKLLPELTYAREMKILCVYNGQGMCRQKDLDFDEIIRRRRLIDAS